MKVFTKWISRNKKILVQGENHASLLSGTGPNDISLHALWRLQSGILRTLVGQHPGKTETQRSLAKKWGEALTLPIDVG